MNNEGGGYLPEPLGFEAGPNFYTYVRQNPWTSFDPEGLNDVVVSGGISERSPTSAVGFVQRLLRKAGGPGARIAHDVNWRNFIKAAEANILKKQGAGDTQKIEWLVQGSTYEQRAMNDGKAKDTYTNEIAKFATDHNVELRWFNNKKDFANGINNNVNGTPRQGDERISDYTQYSHGYPGRMALDYSGDINHSIDTHDLKWGVISKSAFQEDSTSTLAPCNSAKLARFGSVRQSWQAATGSTTSGVSGRMDYAPDPQNPAPTAAGAHWVTPVSPAPKPVIPPEKQKQDQQ